MRHTQMAFVKCPWQPAGRQQREPSTTGPALQHRQPACKPHICQLQPDSGGQSANGCASAGGNETIGQALLAWSASIHNFAEVQATNALFGWHEDLVDLPCSWDAITCVQSAGATTIRLHMRFLGLNGVQLCLRDRSHSAARRPSCSLLWGQG